MARRTPTLAQAAASRRNGLSGGRKPGDRAKERERKAKELAYVLAVDLPELLRAERLRNFQFLVDLRDGLMPGSTLLDRLRAVENLLDRDPATARAKGEYDVPTGEGAVPKLFELGPLAELSAPAGWREHPYAPEAVASEGGPAASDSRATESASGQPVQAERANAEHGRAATE